MNGTNSRPLLIVDGQNMAIRAFCASNAVSTHGHQAGLVVGSLSMLRKMVNDIVPRGVIVVWEAGGSPRRRAVYSEYKMGRKPLKLNRFYDDDIPESEENKQHQLIVLIKCLRNLPIRQVYVQDLEGDDVVAHIVRNVEIGTKKVIASSDKDMFQLIDDDVSVWSWSKKGFVTKEDVIAEYDTHPQNFGLLKSICGDSSDNIPGVKGFGYKTATKRFPMLKSDTSLLLEDLLKYSHTHSGVPAYKRVIDEWEYVQRNWKLVNLNCQTVSHSQAQVIDGRLSAEIPKINKMNLIKTLLDDGICGYDVDGLVDAFYLVNEL